MSPSVSRLQAIYLILSYFFKFLIENLTGVFGIIDKVSTYDDIKIMFMEEDIERPKQQVESDIEEYEQYLKGENGES